MKRIGVLFSLAAILSGCMTTPPKPDPSILRVGVTPDAQPIIFKQGGQIIGIEADFADQLGRALNRKVVFVEVPWDEQLNYLEQNKTDIAMSGITLTPARTIRVNFVTPYLRSGLTGLFRRDSYDPSGLVASTVRNQTKRLGYVRNTTGEQFCMQNFNRAQKSAYKSTAAAVAALKSGKIDMLIHDAPVVWWLSAINEADLVAFPEVLNTEPLAWAVGKHNVALLEQANALVAQWEKDGTSAKIVNNWIPKFGR